MHASWLIGGGLLAGGAYLLYRSRKSSSSLPGAALGNVQRDLEAKYPEGVPYVEMLTLKTRYLGHCYSMEKAAFDVVANANFDYDLIDRVLENNAAQQVAAQHQLGINPPRLEKIQTAYDVAADKLNKAPVELLDAIGPLPKARRDQAWQALYDCDVELHRLAEQIDPAIEVDTKRDSQGLGTLLRGGFSALLSVPSKIIKALLGEWFWPALAVLAVVLFLWLRPALPGCPNGA